MDDPNTALVAGERRGKDDGKQNTSSPLADGPWANIAGYRQLSIAIISDGILEQSLGARNQVGIARVVVPAQPGYIGWWNRFVEIYSWAP